MLDACSRCHLFSDNSLLLGCVIVCRLVLHQGSGTATIEEVDLLTLATATVGNRESAIKVRHKVDFDAIDLTLGQDSGNLDTNVGLGV